MSTESITEPKRRRRPNNRDKLIVFVERPRCPYCCSTELKTRRTTRDGESITRNTECQTCMETFLVVME